MEYVREIIISAVVCGIVMMLAPENSGRKYLSFAVALVMLTAVARPLITLDVSGDSLKKQLDRLSTDDTCTAESYEEVVADAVAAAAAKSAAEHFSVPSAEISVSVKLENDAEGVEIESCEITVTGSAARLSRGSLERYFSEITGSEVSVYGCEE